MKPMFLDSFQAARKFDLAPFHHHRPENVRPRLETLFERQAQATPDAAAILRYGQTTSFRELDERANRIAHHLRECGVQAGQIVGLCLNRSVDLIAALLGVLKAGAAYLPLDPQYPADRIQYMLADSGALMLITHRLLRSDVTFSGQIIDLDQDCAMLARQAVSCPAPWGTGHDPAYLIYTSGSTGQPKGVMLSHSAVALVEWGRQSFSANERSRIAATTSICFDPSIVEIFLPLCLGGLLILKDNLLEPFTPDEQPTMMNGVASAFAELARAHAIPDSVRVINIGGEVLKADIVRRIYENSRVEAVYNHYGPTEATTCTTVALVRADASQDPPLGAPICGAELHLLDEDGEPVPFGAEGEICIGGDSLAIGYLNRPDQTASKFVTDWSRATSGRLYRTGDIARYDETGDLRFIGRVDDQVKFRGYRIETGEIEAALMRIPHVEQAAVAIHRGHDGREQLVGYALTRQPLDLDAAKDRLAQWLPQPMRPAALIVLETFPLTLSGKVDRNALPAPIRAVRPEPQTRIKRPPVEEFIASVFQTTLELPYVASDDDFFELGGDSLRAVELALELEQHLGQSIPPAMLIQCPTPRAIADALGRRLVEGSDHVTVLQGEGPGTPIFMLPDLFGRPLNCVALAKELGCSQRVYGLSPGPREDEQIARPDVRTLSIHYAAAMREQQPAGPYQLCAYSFAGLAAFDLASLLETQGEAVTLILLDSTIRTVRPPVSAIFRWALREGFRSIRTRGVLGAMRRVMKTRRAWCRPWWKVRLQDVPRWVPNNDKALALSLMRARLDYRPQPFFGRSIVIQCADQEPLAAFLGYDGLLGWRDLLKGRLTHIIAPTSHAGLIRKPYVSVLAAELLRLLSRVGELPDYKASS
jgi:amino acid adenylation domain-containing protein